MLAFLGEEPGWAEVDEVLRMGEPWMTLVNLRRGRLRPRALVRAWRRRRGVGLPAGGERPGGVAVRWLGADDHLVRRAAGMKAQGGVSYADTFAAGAASLLDCPVLTGDPEFRVAEAAGVTVRWLGRRA